MNDNLDTPMDGGSSQQQDHNTTSNFFTLFQEFLVKSDRFEHQFD